MTSAGSPSEAQFLGASTLQASVVIPTHNRRDQLQRTLLALARQSLSAERFEVLVICAGCTDGTVHMCHEISSDLPYRLRVIEQSNTGLAAARNTGIREGSGALIVPLDADDRLAPTYLGEVVDALDNPHAGENPVLQQSLVVVIGGRDGLTLCLARGLQQPL